MAEIKSHIQEAISICLSFITNNEFDIYSKPIEELFNTLSIPKLKDCPERIINSALSHEPFYLKFEDKTISIPYETNKSFTQNLIIWSNTIKEKFEKDEIDKGLFECINNQISNYKFSDYKSTLKNDVEIDFIKALKEDGIQKKFIFDGYLETKELDFYYHINKSILNAEYLILDNYSKLLTDTVEKIIPSHEEDAITIPFFCKMFLTLAQNLLELCWRIRNVISGKNSRRIEFDSHTEELAEWRFPSKNPPYKSDISDCLFDFTISVIEMTTIDHINKASSKNIECLLTLWKRKENILQKKDSYYNDFDKVIKMVETKNASLLYKMVYDIDDKKRDLIGLKNIDFFFTFEEKNDKEIKEAITTAIMPKGLNPIINYKEKHKDETIDLESLKKEVRYFSSETLPKDIQDYNKWINDGQKYYCDMSPTIKTLQQTFNPKSIESIFNFISDKKPQQLTPYFFFRSLQFIKKQIDNSTDINTKHELANLLHNILVKLTDYVLSFKNSMPPYFRPCFEHSFYLYNNPKNFEYKSLNNPNIISNYDYNNFKNTFFFASYYCSPISINRLEEKLQEYTLYFNSYILNITLELKGTQQKLLEEQQGLDITTKSIEKHQHNSIQVLGLFTAFLSFIVTTVATFRVVNNLREYIIYSLTYTLAIVLFAFLISDHTTKKHDFILKDKESNWFNRLLKNTPILLYNYGKHIAFIITIGLLYLFSKNYFNNNKISKTEEKENNGVTITIDNSSMPSSTLNLSSQEIDTIK